MRADVVLLVACTLITVFLIADVSGMFRNTLDPGAHMFPGEVTVDLPVYVPNSKDANVRRSKPHCAFLTFITNVT